ncbi:CASP-like protein 4D1 [Morus notabilis]|uniref:CASP-like protein 4D1 n=1 Tax=Morus notabilis TaxID=981085 RepID=UPI000CED04F2|nr:CASP-like protein 4D1 [Morus notabilis]
MLLCIVRYVLATAAVGAAYLILQLPFAIYYGCTEKRLIGGTLLPQFDFYADKVVSLLLASGAGAGFAVSIELKKVLPDAFDAIIAIAQASGKADLIEFADLFQQEKSKTPGFFNRGIIASGVLLGGCVLMAIVSVLTSINRSK